MAFWDSITGKAQQETIEQGAGAARSDLQGGYGQAQNYLQQGRQQIQGGYGQSRGAYGRGGAQAVQALRGGASGAYSANDNALAALRGGSGSAIDTVRQGYGQANDALTPYETQGRSANTMYNDAIGANGADAQSRYAQGYQADPSQQYVQDSILKRYNAAGMLDSGASRLASARAHNEGYNQRLGMLQQSGQQGYGAASQMGQYGTQGAQIVAGLQDGQGRGEADLYGQRGNIALGTGRDIANVRTGTANNIGNAFQGQAGAMNNSLGNSAGLEAELAQLIASGRIQEASALMQAQSAGANNILSGLGNIAGTAISGFAPGAGGVSSAGNIMNFLQGGKVV